MYVTVNSMLDLQLKEHIIRKKNLCVNSEDVKL